VVLRANAEGGLVMQQLRYPHEIREFGEVEIEDGGEVKDAELKLALQLIQAATSEEFHPEKYKDDVHVRLQELIQQKIEGHEVVIPEAEAPKAQVIDLMEALKASLSEVTKGSSGKGDGAERKPAKASPRKKAASKKTTKKKSTKKKAS
jgi:DNA end-binding protein Ku